MMLASILKKCFCDLVFILLLLCRVRIEGANADTDAISITVITVGGSSQKAVIIPGNIQRIAWTAVDADTTANTQVVVDNFCYHCWYRFFLKQNVPQNFSSD